MKTLRSVGYFIIAILAISIYFTWQKMPSELIKERSVLIDLYESDNIIAKWRNAESKYIFTKYRITDKQRRVTLVFSEEVLIPDSVRARINEIFCHHAAVDFAVGAKDRKEFLGLQEPAIFLRIPLTPGSE
jgi:hypothetical protein